MPKRKYTKTERDYLTTGEAAKLMRVSPRKIIALCDENCIKSWRLPFGHRDRRLFRKDVLKYMKRTEYPYMIKRVAIFNFQKWKSLTVDFVDGVNFLVGPSYAGKSAILRAIRWCLLNRPIGRSMIRHGATFCRVEIDVNGHKIVRQIGKSNIYKLDGKVLRSFGAGKVPDVIERITRINEINFQHQIAAPYLFADKPGQIAKSLNQVVNLGAIDESLTRIAAAERKAKSVVSVTHERLVAAKAVVKETEWIERCNEQLSACEQLFTAYRETAQDCAGLAVGLVVASELMQARQAALAERQEAGAALAIAEQWVITAAQAEALRQLLSETEQVYSITKRGPPDYSSLDRQRAEGDDIAERHRTLRLLIEDIALQEKTKCEADVTLTRLQKMIAKKYGASCPTCGREL